MALLRLVDLVGILARWERSKEDNNKEHKKRSVVG